MKTPQNGLGVVPAAIVGAAAIGLGSRLGMWYAPWVVGLLWGLVARRTGRALIAGWIMVILGYGGMLVALATSSPVVAAARIVAEIMGFGPEPSLVLVVTLVLGLLLVTTGTWAGLAAARLFSAPARPPVRIRAGH
jgi:hypothetical protein